MPEPYIGEIKITSFAFAPRGWALCNGQLLPINQNHALFSLLGTTYGGNGQTTFALPDLRGRVPMHAGSGHILGERAGEPTHTLSITEFPTHAHVYNGVSETADQVDPSGNRVASVDGTIFGDAYGSPQNLQAMAPQAIGNVGGSQAHDNTQPYLTLNFIIALIGIFPTRN